MTRPAPYMGDVDDVGDCEHDQPLWGMCSQCNRFHFEDEQGWLTAKQQHDAEVAPMPKEG